MLIYHLLSTSVHFVNSSLILFLSKLIVLRTCSLETWCLCLPFTTMRRVSRLVHKQYFYVSLRSVFIICRETAASQHGTCGNLVGRRRKDYRSSLAETTVSLLVDRWSSGLILSIGPVGHVKFLSPCLMFTDAIAFTWEFVHVGMKMHAFLVSYIFPLICV